VGGGDDGAQDEAEAPVKAGEDPSSGGRYAQHRESDEAEGEKENADQIEFEVAPGGQPGGGVQQRRQYDEENNVGIQRDAGDAGNEAEEQAGDDQNDGIGRLEFACEGGEDDDEEKEEKENDFDRGDAAALHHVEVPKVARVRRKREARLRRGGEASPTICDPRSGTLRPSRLG